MKILHRYDSEERQHYLLEKQYNINLKIRLLYTGYLSKTDNWSEMEHSHEFVEIIFVVDGLGTVHVNGVEKEIKKGDLVIYNAGDLHYECSNPADPLEVQFVAFDKLEITELEPNCLLPPHYDFLYHTGSMYDTFQNYFSMIIQESTNKLYFSSEIAQNMARTLVMYVFRALNQNQETPKIIKHSEALNRAVAYIDGHYLDTINLDLISEQCFINKYHLSHLFSKYLNTTIGKYILDKRLDESKRLLHFANLSILEVSRQSGFNDLSYFCRIFKKSTGLTPRQFRNRPE